MSCLKEAALYADDKLIKYHKQMEPSMLGSLDALDDTMSFQARMAIGTLLGCMTLGAAYGGLTGLASITTHGTALEGATLGTIMGLMVGAPLSIGSMIAVPYESALKLRKSVLDTINNFAGNPSPDVQRKLKNVESTLNIMHKDIVGRAQREFQSEDEMKNYVAVLDPNKIPLGFDHVMTIMHKDSEEFKAIKDNVFVVYCDDEKKDFKAIQYEDGKQTTFINGRNDIMKYLENNWDKIPELKAKYDGAEAPASKLS